MTMATENLKPMDLLNRKAEEYQFSDLYKKFGRLDRIVDFYSANPQKVIVHRHLLNRIEDFVLNLKLDSLHYKFGPWTRNMFKERRKKLIDNLEKLLYDIRQEAQ